MPGCAVLERLNREAGRMGRKKMKKPSKARGRRNHGASAITFWKAIIHLVAFIMISTAVTVCATEIVPCPRDITNNNGIDPCDSRSIAWHPAAPGHRIAGAALVIHGLNLKPSKMQTIMTFLTRQGIACLNLSLRGHGDNYDSQDSLSVEKARLSSFADVSYTRWEEESFHAYLLLRRYSNFHNVPSFFVGYSLGALIGCNLVTRKDNVSFDKMILFAPALAPTVLGKTVKLLFFLHHLIVPTLAPEDYRNNWGVPLTAYRALYEGIDLFNSRANHRLNVPTILFLDEHDEFINWKEIDSIITRRKLDRWIIQKVMKDRDKSVTSLHHLVIDEDSVGKNCWRRMETIMKDHIGMMRVGTSNDS
ncbi:MAG: alpha/beta fold hydrolase [Deltaproteobacteria bacterium]|nr:alpha/beta fold hydrolase [Deltaproteobacteria bacterium]